MRYTFKCQECGKESEQVVSQVLEEGSIIELSCEACNKTTRHSKQFVASIISGRFGDNSTWR